MVNWNKKTSYEIEYKNNLINYNIDYGVGFNAVDKNKINNLPQSKPWKMESLKLSLFQTTKISNEWAFGSGLSSYITKLSDYLNNNKMKNKLNLKIDGKVTRNFNEKFFISIGGSVSSKYLTEIENIKFNQKTESIFNSPYAQLNLTFWLILNDNKNKSSHNEKIFFNETRNRLINNGNEKALKERTLIEHEKKIPLQSLKNYAIEFAKKGDEISSQLFNF